MRNALFAALAVFVAGPAMAEGLETRDLEVMPAAPAVSSVALDAWFDHPDATYALGDALRMFVRSNADGYVTAFSIGASGAVTQIYPNAFHPDNALRAGTTIEIPGAGARAVVSGTVGAERIEVVLTRRSGPVCRASELAGQQGFRSVFGGAAALQRDLDVVAATEPQGWLATIEKRLLTVPAPTVVGSHFPTSTVVVVIPGQGYPLAQY